MTRNIPCETLRRKYKFSKLRSHNLHGPVIRRSTLCETSLHYSGASSASSLASYAVERSCRRVSNFSHFFIPEASLSVVGNALSTLSRAFSRSRVFSRTSLYSVIIAVIARSYASRDSLCASVSWSMSLRQPWSYVSSTSQTASSSSTR